MRTLDNPNIREDLRPYLWTPDHICGLDSFANRIGEDYTDKFYVVYTYAPNEGSILKESNYQSILKYLKNNFPEHAKYIQERRTSHWTYSYFDSITVDTDAPGDLLDDLAYILNGMEGYPVFDDSDFSERECEYVDQGWSEASLRERIRICSDAGVSIFASRWDYVHTDPNGYIHEHFVQN